MIQKEEGIVADCNGNRSKSNIYIIYNRLRTAAEKPGVLQNAMIMGGGCSGRGVVSVAFTDLAAGRKCPAREPVGDIGSGASRQGPLSLFRASLAPDG